MLVLQVSGFESCLGLSLATMKVAVITVRIICLKIRRNWGNKKLDINGSKNRTWLTSELPGN